MTTVLQLCFVGRRGESSPACVVALPCNGNNIGRQHMLGYSLRAWDQPCIVQCTMQAEQLYDNQHPFQVWHNGKEAGYA